MAITVAIQAIQYSVEKKSFQPITRHIVYHEYALTVDTDILRLHIN